jgi:hypothetical protein
MPLPGFPKTVWRVMLTRVVGMFKQLLNPSIGDDDQFPLLVVVRGLESLGNDFAHVLLPQSRDHYKKEHPLWEFVKELLFMGNNI